MEGLRRVDGWKRDRWKNLWDFSYDRNRQRDRAVPQFDEEEEGLLEVGGVGGVGHIKVVERHCIGTRCPEDLGLPLLAFCSLQKPLHSTVLRRGVH